jgi:hypothetical protein
MSIELIFGVLFLLYLQQLLLLLLLLLLLVSAGPWFCLRPPAQEAERSAVPAAFGSCVCGRRQELSPS